MNRLARESSLYLRQHGSNPVDWWPWCEEAFDQAAREDKPVLISIGYASCHWCHVMAHESFEDPCIASLMNRLFVNIKVDREERPDVDQIYMESVQMLNQQGGWPLNVFCLPDKRPFTGGTYFPPEDRGQGMIPWPHLLVRVAEAYRTQRFDLEQNAKAICENLIHLSESILEQTSFWTPDLLIEGAKRLCSNHDDTYGGFGGAPKFPPSQVLGFLNAVRATSACEQDAPALRDSIDRVLLTTSRALVRSGLHDHVGGGFFRYTVDVEWRIPHFEKMLYDQALILESLVKLWSRYRWAWLDAPIGRSINWMREHFQVSEGVFAASLDADTEEGEGAFYLWSHGELKEALPSSAFDLFCSSFGVHGSSPVNFYPWSCDDQDYESALPLLEDLEDLRSRRPTPTRDDKILVAWNALALRMLALAGWIRGEPSWLQSSIQGLDWLWEHACDGTGQVGAVFRSHEGSWTEGFLDDHVNYALACLQVASVVSWLDPERERHFRERAVLVTNHLIEAFSDPDGEGFFFCSESQSRDVIVRKKEWYDNAYPSGNSSLVHLFAQLAVLEEDARFRQELARLKEAYVERSRRIPNGVAFGLEGLTWDALGMVVIKMGPDVDRSPLVSMLQAKPWRPIYLMVSEAGEADAIQVCVGTTCYAPTKEAAEAAAMV